MNVTVTSQDVGEPVSIFQANGLTCDQIIVILTGRAWEGWCRFLAPIEGWGGGEEMEESKFARDLESTRGSTQMKKGTYDLHEPCFTKPFIRLFTLTMNNDLRTTTRFIYTAKYCDLIYHRLRSLGRMHQCLAAEYWKSDKTPGSS